MRSVRARRSDEGEPLYLFLHVAKTAGLTVSEYLEGAFGPHTVSLYGKEATKSEVWAAIVRARPDVRRLRAIYGHRVFDGLDAIADREARYFTFLRDPVARCVSMYNFGVDTGRFSGGDAQEPVSFDAFLQRPESRNGMLRFLYHAIEGEHAPGYDLEHPTPHHLERAKEFLQRCWFVGFVESFEQDLDHLAAAVAVPSARRHVNPSNPHFDLAADPGVERQILEVNEFDAELYEYARTLRRTRE